MKTIDKEQAKVLAKEYMANQLLGFAYPIVPTDDWGNPEPYEVGCVPWVSCTSVSIDDVYIEDEELTPEGSLIVFVSVYLTWNRENDDGDDEEDSENDAIYEVEVRWDKNELTVWNWERVD